MKRNRLYSRREPDKEGKLYFIFCEGEKRETTYFYFFNRIASQIIIQLVPIEAGKNSPMGLYNNAVQQLVKNEGNPNPACDINEGDEVWFVIDTDKWGKEVDRLRACAARHNNWRVAQSNPCFEVWLYYHFANEKPKAQVANWKEYLNKIVPGGFNSNKHPVYIAQATKNSELHYSATGNQPDVNTTELHVLAKQILPLVRESLDLLLKEGEM